MPFATITSLSESPLKFGLIWAGTDDGLVWVTDDGGNRWKKVSKQLTKGKWVSRVIASPHQEKRAWLAFNNYRNDDIKPYLYKTENLGKNWRNMSKGLPNETINVVKEDPKNENIVYVGTDKGIYVSTNQGKDWDMLGNELPTTPVHDLIVHPRENELVLGTHGRSVFVADVNPLQTMTSEISESALHVYPMDEIKSKGSWNSIPFRWSYTDDMSDHETVNVWAAEVGKAEVSITNADGAVYHSTDVELHKGLNQWRWDYKIDIEKAIEIEANAVAAAAEKATEDDPEAEPQPTNKADTPYAESKRLGHPDFIEAGDYKLVIKQGEAEHSVDFKVK